METTIEKNNLGVEYFLNHDFKNAEMHYQEAIAEDNANTIALNNLGLLYHQKKEYKKAVHYFSKAIFFVPKVTYHLNLANSLVYLNEYNEAEKMYKKCLEMDSEHKNAKISLARFYQANKTPQRATKIWISLLNTSNEESYKIELAKNYMMLNMFEKAIDILSYLTPTRDEPILWYFTGICEFNLKNFGLSEIAFRKCLSLEPDNYKARHYLAINYLSKGNSEKAIREFDFILKTDPENSRIKLNKISILLNLSRYEESQSLVEEVLIKEPKNPKALRYEKIIQEIISN